MKILNCFKERTFGELREECNWYYVVKSAGLFGDFRGWSSIITPKEVRVLARNHKEAAERYDKRNYTKRPTTRTQTSQFAKYRVRRKDKPKHERHYRYFK